MSKKSRKKINHAGASSRRECLARVHDAEYWFLHCRQVIDYEAISQMGDAALHLVAWIADWEAFFRRGSACRPERVNAALAATCRQCEEPHDELFPRDELRCGRPGAVDPLHACAGCVHSYRGELEADRSLVAAYATRPDLERNQLRDRVRRHLEHEQHIRQRLSERRAQGTRGGAR